MTAFNLTPASLWNKYAAPVTACLILLIVATDQRPDDTSGRTTVAAIAIGVFALADLLFKRNLSNVRHPNTLWSLPAAVILFLTLCTVSAAWAGEPVRALGVMVVAWVAFFAWLILQNWAYLRSLKEIESLLRCICAVFIVFVVLVDSETATSQSIHEYLVNSLGMDMSIPNFYVGTNGHISVSMQFLAQHVATISYLFWPMLLAIYLTFGKARFFVCAIFSMLTIYALFFSINETAMLAMTLSSAAFLLALILPRTTVILTGLAFGFLSLAVVPLANLAYQIFQLQLNLHIPPSGQARFHTWFNVASSVPEQLFLGHGVVHLRTLLYNGQGFIWEHAHSHNVFLQTWYEVGLIGALLIFMIGTTFLVSIYRSPRTIVCFAVAAFVAITLSFATTAWELWVPWHLGLIAILAQITTLIGRIVSADTPPPKRRL